MNPFTRTIVPLLSTVACAAVLVSVSEVRAGSEPCTTENFTSDKVEAACRKGGRDAAKRYMKSVVKKAKKAGKDVSCPDCHESLASYELEDGAAMRLAKLEKL